MANLEAFLTLMGNRQLWQCYENCENWQKTWQIAVTRQIHKKPSHL